MGLLVGTNGATGVTWTEGVVEIAAVALLGPGLMQVTSSVVRGISNSLDFELSPLAIVLVVRMGVLLVWLAEPTTGEATTEGDIVGPWVG